MQRERKHRAKQHSKVGNLFGEMPFIPEHNETSTPILSPDRKSLQVYSRRKTATPPPPKAYKIVIPYTIPMRGKVPDIPFPQSPALVSINKTKLLSSVPPLCDLNPDAYQLSRAQAA